MSEAGGRLRDATTVKLPSEELIAELGAVVTSNGKLLLVDLQRVMGSDDELQYESIVLGSSAIPVEPRLTCVTGALLAAKSTKRAADDVESGIPTVPLPPHVDEEFSNEEEIEDVVIMEEKKVKKRKKVKHDSHDVNERLATKKKKIKNIKMK